VNLCPYILHLSIHKFTPHPNWYFCKAYICLYTFHIFWKYQFELHEMYILKIYLQAQHWNICRFATHKIVNWRKIHFQQIKVTYTSEPFCLRLLGNLRKKIIDTVVYDPYSPCKHNFLTRNGDVWLILWLICVIICG